MKKTIIFDVDGTLLDSEKIYMRAWKEAGAKFGYTITDEVLLQTRAVNAQVAEAAFRKCCGADFPLETIHAERVRIAEALIAQAPKAELLKPYARQILEYLRSEGYPLAVASTTAQEKTRSHLAHAGLLEFFPVVVCGDMVERGKPEPDIFLKAAVLSGAEPADCIVVGDSPADVNAAYAAKIPMVLIPDQVPLNPDTQSKSRFVLQDLSQLRPILDQI